MCYTHGTGVGGQLVQERFATRNGTANAIAMSHCMVSIVMRDYTLAAQTNQRFEISVHIDFRPTILESMWSEIDFEVVYPTQYCICCNPLHLRIL